MDIPVEIAFHNTPSLPKLEAKIRERVGKLDRLYHHLIGCRVSVEQLHRRHQNGNLFEVHIDMRVPGDKIVVSHEPHRAREKFADPDVGIALRNAFKAAERRLLVVPVIDSAVFV
jgi:ribosome-associated translation inhibitor RaiA